MKKTYKNPTLMVVKIHSENIMQQGSPAAPTMRGINANSTAMGREGRFSADEWDEE